MNKVDKIASELYQIGVFKIGDFILKSGDASPYYLDLRLVPSFPKLFTKINKMYIDLIKNLEYSPDGIAGIISAGIPFATAICLELDLPLLQIRKEKKSYGDKNLIEGRTEPGDKIVIVDDLISTGTSKIPAIEALRTESLIVSDIVVLIDRRDPAQQGSIKNTKIHASFSLQDLARSLWENPEIDLPFEVIQKIQQMLPPDSI